MRRLLTVLPIIGYPSAEAEGLSSVGEVQKWPCMSIETTKDLSLDYDERKKKNVVINPLVNGGLVKILSRRHYQ